MVFKDTIDADPIFDDCEDAISAFLIYEAMDTLIDCVFEDGSDEDWLREDAVSSVVVGELTCFVVGRIVDDWLLEELLDTVLERLPDEGIVLLLEELD